MTAEKKTPMRTGRHKETLSERQKTFLGEYLRNGRRAGQAWHAMFGKNDTPAARKYSAEEGCRMLSQRPIARYLRELADKEAALTSQMLDDVALNQANIIREVINIATSNIVDYVGEKKPLGPIDMGDITRDQAAAVAEITVDYYTEGRGEQAREVKRVRLKLHDKLAALKTLMASQGWDKPKPDPAAAKEPSSLLKLILESYEEKKRLTIEGEPLSTSTE